MPLSKFPAVITSAEVLNLIGGRPVLMPPRLRRTWSNSRLVGLEDGSTMPLLHIIAEAKFGPWDPSKYYPVWADQNWCHEDLENVVLVEKAAPREHRPKSQYGVPAGSREYYKRYRAAHPEKVSEWSKKAYVKRKEAIAQTAKLEARVRELEAKLGISPEPPDVPVPVEQAAKLETRLAEIMAHEE